MSICVVCLSLYNITFQAQLYYITYYLHKRRGQVKMGRDPHPETWYDQAALVGVVWHSTRQLNSRNSQVCVIPFQSH